MKEGGFIDLMSYSGKKDTLEASDTFVNGESEILNRISNFVKEYSGNWEAMWDNIKMRAEMKKTMVDVAEKMKKSKLLEADWIVKSNTQFHNIADKVRQETGAQDTKRVFKEWSTWFKTEAQGK